jgi:hypothetical protein
MEDLNLLERFAAHARDFVRTFIDDEWSHLEQYFPIHATYETVGECEERFIGRPALRKFGD